jgi:lipopolysaccharide assembly protein A
MKFLWWIALAVVALVLILFAVSNRESVSVGLWPLPDFVELPLYLLVLGTLIIGFFFGELVAWASGWRWRREARRSRERIALLERELDAERARPVVARLPANEAAQ